MVKQLVNMSIGIIGKEHCIWETLLSPKVIDVLGQICALFVFICAFQLT